MRKTAPATATTAATLIPAITGTLDLPASAVPVAGDVADEGAPDVVTGRSWLSTLIL